jgi:hypothetical protein
MMKTNHSHVNLYPVDGLLYAEVAQRPGQKPSCPACDFQTMLAKLREQFLSQVNDGTHPIS